MKPQQNFRRSKLLVVIMIGAIFFLVYNTHTPVATATLTSSMPLKGFLLAIFECLTKKNKSVEVLKHIFDILDGD